MDTETTIRIGIMRGMNLQGQATGFIRVVHDL
jgi:hypothetical protein